MGASKQLLTSKEFADRSGLPVSKITKLLRDGRLRGQKKAGKWMIPESELKTAKPPKPSPSEVQPRTPPPPATAAAPAASPDQTYSVAEFSAMTYLTEFGVHDWLRKGRLKGARSADGEWRIDAANIEAPHIKRLVR